MIKNILYKNGTTVLVAFYKRPRYGSQQDSSNVLSSTKIYTNTGLYMMG